MSPEVAAILGVAVGSLGTLLVTFITTRAGERKHHRSLIYQAGVENFKQSCAFALQSGGGTAPMEDFILNIAVIADKLAKNQSLSKDDVIRILREGKEVSDTIWNFRHEEPEKS